MAVREPFKIIRQNWPLVSFCGFYLLGLIAGIVCVTQYSVTSLVRLLSYSQMSIVVGFLMSAVPFLVFYIVFRCSAFYLIVPLAFLRAFSFMYCFAGISIAYADAGWLVRSLLLFSDCFSVPLLIWYVSGGLLENRRTPDRRIWFCILSVFAVRCIDCFVISPFVLELLSF